MGQDFLSNIDLFYTGEDVIDNQVIISGEEVHHIKDVLRYSINDQIYVTDGKGSFYKCKLTSISKTELQCSIDEVRHYDNHFENFTFCIPRLRTQDRLEFALEKCVELGITNFIIFDSIRTVIKGAKLDRWQKVIASAMKQSLRAWLPKISYVKSVSEIALLPGRRVVFEQSATTPINKFLTQPDFSSRVENIYFLFGPEGGFADEEIAMTKKCSFVKLTDNRLRAETAVVTAASILALELI
ncbi:MAG: 16S rRNA (uracil(1498)-N(3))-methyltransferase [Melioribacter sp.]|nr:16S rRNA (uracil(1498)-N(3))-methyltransferase [Melioribacter sp.]